MHKLILDTQTLALIVASLRTSWFEDHSEAYEKIGRPDLDVFNEDTIGELIGELTGRLESPDPLPETMGEEMFVEYFKPSPLPGNGDLLDYPAVSRQPENRVWTITEGDGGNWYAAPGFHQVNRLGYILTDRPWTPDMKTVAEWLVEPSLHQVQLDTYQVNEAAEHATILIGSGDAPLRLFIDMRDGQAAELILDGPDTSTTICLDDRKVTEISLEDRKDGTTKVVYS